MKKTSILRAVPPPPMPPPSGFWHRVVGRFCLPFRGRSAVESAADQHRAARLFSMNYSKSWKR